MFLWEGCRNTTGLVDGLHIGGCGRNAVIDEKAAQDVIDGIWCEIGVSVRVG